MHYDEDFIPSDRVSKELLRKIEYLVKQNKKHDNGLEDILDEVIFLFYPRLSAMI